MSREIRRVPVDFDWPLKEVWHGYLMPDELREASCPDCKRGYSPHGEYLFDLWYGYVPFDPRSTGSTYLTANSPGPRARAERNIAQSPHYYGRGEYAIVQEAQRLADLWNGMWCHHLSQLDVDALIAEERLMGFTHTFDRDRPRGDRFRLKEPPYRPTAAEVNEWSLDGMGHDSLNAGYCVRARCKREGFPEICDTCQNHASVEKYPGQRAEAEAWEHTEPPTGDGWQVWETTSEGSPISPVFAERDALIDFLMSDRYFGFGTSPTPLTREQAEAFVGASHSIGSMVTIGGRAINGDAAVHEVAIADAGDQS